MPKKLYIKTHGCQMNEYDSEKMSKLLVDKKNFEITTSEQDADLIILNTCSIREKAQERVFHQIGRWRKIKEKKPNLKSLLEDVLLHKKEKKLLKERQKLT
jgi:tRNA-2-methylthio-N6-dimethylallyladenosine synthase